MKATVTADSLATVASWVARTVPAKPVVPVLGGVLIDATSGEDRDEVTLSAFDFDTAGVARLDAGVISVDQPGRVLVSGRLLAAVAGALGKGNGTVTLVADDINLVVTDKRGRSELPLMNADDYPALPATAAEVGTIDPGVLLRAIERVVDAVSGDAAVLGGALTGVSMSADPGGPLTFVATDRYRLAVCEVPWTPSGDGELPVTLIPETLLRFVASAVTSAKGPVTIHAEGGTVGFATGERTISGRLIGADYPKWRNVDATPDDPKAKLDTSCVVAVADLKAAVARASVMLIDPPHVELRFGPAGVEVGVPRNDERGGADALAEVAAFAGEEVAHTLNAGYLRDLLAAMGTDRVRFDVPSIHRPLLARPVRDERDENGDFEVAPGYRHTLVPVRGVVHAEAAA